MVRQSNALTGLSASILLALNHQAQAASTRSAEAIADTFLTSDPATGGGTGASRANADSDNSAYGAMMISANVSDPLQGINYPRAMDLLVAYSASTIKSGFDGEFGPGNWHVTSVRLKWYSNFDILGVPANNNQFNIPAAGSFNVYYFPDNSWFDPATAGPSGLTVSSPKVTWNSVFTGGGAYTTLFSGQHLAGTFAYTGGTYNGTTDCYTVPDSCPPRYWNLNLSPAITDAITHGGYLSFRGTAADSQVVYLVNQLTKPGAHPQIFVTADIGPASTQVPFLPNSALWIMGTALAGVSAFMRYTSLSRNR